MSEWIVDTRGGVCNQCDSEYQRLAQHWSRNRHCSYRELSDSQHEAIRGCLVGDGNLDNPNDGPPALRFPRCAGRILRGFTTSSAGLSVGLLAMTLVPIGFGHCHIRPRAVLDMDGGATVRLDTNETDCTYLVCL